MTLQILNQGLVSEDALWEAVLTDFGVPRLKVARGYFSNLVQEDVPLLVEAFKYWQNYVEYMLIVGENQFTGEKIPLAVKCSKRGNDVFARRLDKKLSFLNQYSDIKFFDVSDFDKGKKVYARLLWVTLTYDSKRCSLREAWRNCMKEFNLWITNLRNRWGRIGALRFIMPFPGKEGKAYAYPHFHVVLLFEDVEFTVFPHMEKDGEGKLGLVFRIEEKDELHEQGKWHSHIDVKAISSMNGVLNYCRKYAQNQCYGDSDEAILNSAMLWLFRKQTYSLSGGFRKAFSEFIVPMQVSKVSVQKTLDGKEIPGWVWSFLGIFSASELGIEDPHVWVASISEDLANKLVESRVRRYG